MANKVYTIEETAIEFKSTGGVDFTATSLASGAGRQSAQHDLGTSARSRIFAWRAFCQHVATPAVGEVVRVYLKTDDTVSHPDNDDGTSDAAVSAEDKLRNLHHIGNIVLDEAAADIEFVASGVVEINARKVQVVFWNAAATAFTATATEHGFVLTPMPDEVQ